MVPEISLSLLLKSLVPDTYKVKPETLINVLNLGYYERLSKVLQSTPRATLRTYFQWRVIKEWADYIHDDFTSPIETLWSRVDGVASSNSTVWRAGFCLQFLEEGFRDGFNTDNGPSKMYSALHVEQALQQSTKELGENIIASLKAAFLERLEAVEWMPKWVKQRAASKG
jgi:predicted metalloendopeptidase